MARLYRVILPVNDVDAAATFFSTILGARGRRVSPGRHYFDCEGTILACYDPSRDHDRHEARPNPETLYFAVSDLGSAYDACKRAGATFSDESLPGVGPLGEIAARPWGETSFYVRDPFGNQLCFVDRRTVFTGDPG